jgi:hypothetical protein
MLYVAAFLIIVLGLGHSFLGEREILMPLSRNERQPAPLGSTEFSTCTPRFVRILRVTWHLLTLAWFAFAVLLLQLARNRLSATNTTQLVGWLFIASGLPLLILTRGKDWKWLVFFLIGGLLLAWSLF